MRNYHSPIHHATIAWLMLSLVLVIAPHTTRLPIWIPLVGLGFGLWRWLAAKRRLPLPGTLLRVIMLVAIAVGVFLSYGRLFGRDAGTAWLIILIALKLIELRTHRDAVIVVLLAYFLVITNFLFTQSIPTAIYMILIVIVITSTLIAINYMERDPLPIKRRLRISATLLAQAVPMMLVLFVLFPRVPGPLWSLPKDAHSSLSGLDDSMSPGSISELIQSGGTAFRVEFIDPAPPSELRYWRGPVLWHFDGRRWSGGFSKRDLPHDDFTPVGDPVRYSVTLEPHNRRWLFALELPDTLPLNSSLSGDYRLLAASPVRERLRYQLSSYPAFKFGELISHEAKLAALQLPDNGISRSRALAAQWRAASRSDREVVNRALNHFNQQPFVYTLRPPLLGNRPVDQFLFDSQRGFCEHYAGAFTVLMRAASIPARVVTGYLGGERNPLDEFYTVRNSDAHAWSEVWLEGEGWRRIDPTGAVAPERVEEGIEASLPDDAPLPILLRSNNTLLKQFRFSIDALNNGWNQWVLGYGDKTQREFLAKLGIGLDSWEGMAIGLLTSMGTLFAIITALMLWRHGRQHHVTPLQRLYRRFCAKLAKAGINRNPYEGPEDFAQRVIKQRPDLRQAVRSITKRYIQLNYAGSSDASQLKALQIAVTRFSASR
ncbi:hypothetical protein BOW53_06495 [Solemya pervernicosa gill symbiont]|uniref:Transglutaminase-like domain-containing protein n=2 Tax=Gammaproteobacteria incertae sedis TaxID=118884 RepID=A0A1T2L6Q6_9GAMM|nr:DUF3488 and DUF4129 domain-containing transglutaminase family protein [Candidatus Reidiella endopervernicosa]OOZ40763.1 hypothetical protein BOW53_06495 [Solemya pervernicosa gill symbiont]QKQ26403.1 DUF3488 domain-containing transglutaminase family protein [Candidatus Reidiella endopervernicosa]